VMDHHSNIVPWQIAAKEKGLVIKYCTLTNDYQLDLAHFQRILNDNTKIVSFPHMSNVLGTINPVREITRLAHQHNAIVVVDGAQAIPHMPVNVKELEVDMYAFSSHKMLVTLPPFMTGGGTILDVTLQGTTFAAGPERYEAGTPNIADVIAFGTAIEYLQTIGMNKIAQHEMELTQYALIKLSAIPSIIVHGSKTNRGGVVSFSHPTIHPHDMAQVLDTEGVAVRAGHHCAKPLMQWLGITGCTRASFYLYNTKADIDTLVFGIQKAIEVFQC
jgi:cysteine desulfurase / selenocysteine lyase